MRMARRRNSEESGSKFLRLFSFEHHLCLRLRGEFGPVNDSPAAEMGGILLRLGHIIPVSQENGAKPSHLFETSEEMGEEFGRIDQSVFLRMPKEIAVSPEGLGRIESGIVDSVFEVKRKIFSDSFGVVLPQGSDGTGGTGEKSLDGMPCFLVCVRLREDEGVVSRVVKSFRRDLATGIAVDAGLIDKEFAGYILRDLFLPVCHV